MAAEQRADDALPGESGLPDPRRPEPFLFDIVENTSAVIYVKSLPGRYLFVNRHWEKLFKIPRDRVLGATDHDLFPHPTADAFRHNDHLVADRGEVQQFQEHVPHEDGLHSYVSVKFPLRDHAGRAYAVAGISTDITEQVRAEQAHAQLESELRAAEAVQQRLYPAAPPPTEGLDIAGATYPAAVTCGDYFDFIPLPDGALVAAVGDVSGHGLVPALHMVETRAYLRALLLGEVGLSQCLRRLNVLLASDMAEGSFVSLFLARFMPGDRWLTYASAGHEARVLRADGPVERLVNTGLVLGLVTDFEPPQEVTVPLGPGDVLLLPTDGLAETLSPADTMFGWNRILEIARNHGKDAPHELIDRLHRAARDFAENLPQRDDITMVIAKVR